MPVPGDTFRNHEVGLNSPANDAATVVTSDTVSLTSTSRFLYVGGAGDVKVAMAGGETVIFKAVPAGTQLQVRVTKVFATLTTATNIIALW